jgi:hypothetical protein
MTYRDHMIERFPCGAGLVGYDARGDVLVEGDGDIGDAPLLDAIRAIQDPSAVAEAFAAARLRQLPTPFYAGANVAGLTLDADGVLAELDLPDDSYEQRLTLDAFEPMLRAWEQAWRGAQAQLAKGAAQA